MKNMKTITSAFFFLSLLLCGYLGAESPEATTTSPPPPTPETTARVVQYGERDVIPVKAKLRFTTLIVLPKTEQILDFVCGDKEFWVVNGAQNFAYVKPAKGGGRTNLNLVTASGIVYSFVLTEGDGDPDLKLFVEPREESMISAVNGAPKFVSAQQVEDYRQQVEIAKNEAREAKQAAHNAIQRDVLAFQADYPTRIRSAYRFPQNQRPFLVSAIFHDDKFTYIQATPQEVPALYEMKDGKPNLIQFQFRNGTYIVDKILDSGYLAIGKQQLPFSRQD